MDVYSWLDARRGALLRKLPGLESLELALWEGGVLVSLRAGGQEVGLKFRERHDGASYGTTRSMSVALELQGNATLGERAKGVVETLLGLLDRVDDGSWDVPCEQSDEPDEGPGAGARHTKDVPGEAAEASPARDTAMLGFACVADQRALLARWHEPEAAVIVLEGDGWVGGRPVAAAAQHAVEGAATGTVLIDARHGTEAATAAVVAAARGAGAAEVWSIGAHRAPGARPILPWPERPGSGGWTAVRLDQLDAQTLPELRAWASDGGGVVLLPAQGEGPDPLTVASLVDTLPSARVLAAGLPLCQLPAVPRAAIPVALLGVAGDGTVHTEVCGYCDRSAACAGVPRSTFAAWGMRGLTPLFDA